MAAGSTGEDSELWVSLTLMCVVHDAGYKASTCWENREIPLVWAQDSSVRIDCRSDSSDKGYLDNPHE